MPAGHEFFYGFYHEGKACYTYLPAEEDRIFDGSFRYWQYYDFRGYEAAKGAFENNHKTGSWTFERHTGRGNRKLHCGFVDGCIDGPVMCDYNYKKMGKLKRINMEFQVVGGKIVGDITGHLDEGDLKAHCDEDGRADGEWSLTQYEQNEPSVIRREFWNHGTLNDSYELHLRSNRKHRRYKVRLRERVNFFLHEDLRDLLNIVERGTLGASLHVFGERKR